jgi:hypothetical protein
MLTINVKRGRSLSAKGGNLNSVPISITKLHVAKREIGGVHSTYDSKDNKTLLRKGTLL